MPDYPEQALVAFDARFYEVKKLRQSGGSRKEIKALKSNDIIVPGVGIWFADRWSSSGYTWEPHRD